MLSLKYSDGTVIKWEITDFSNTTPMQTGWYQVEGASTYQVVFNFNRITFEDYAFLWLSHCQFTISIPTIWQLMELHNGKPVVKKSDTYWEISGDQNTLSQRLGMQHLANEAVQRIHPYSIYKRVDPDAAEIRSAFMDWVR